MKNLVIFGLFIICLVAAQVSFAQTTDEIVEKYIDALGGKDNMNALQTVQMSGSMSVQSADVALVITRKHMVGARTDISVMGTENYQIVTPEKSWSFMPIQGQSSPEEVSAEQHNAMVTQLDVQGSLVNYKEKGSSVEYKGKETVDGAECYKLVLTYKTGKVANYFIDTKTNRLIKSSSKMVVNGEEMENATSFSNFKQNADGYWFPYTQISSRGELSIDTVETNIKVDDAIFKVN
ncbi:MAG: hypothetical protein IPP48_03665 [Chitinophagaceae bacterium]|nr:hypothetical protein [Chitinophagaceae bacterium]